MHGGEPSADEYQCHKSSHYWKFGETRDRTFPNTFRGCVPLPAPSAVTSASRLTSKQDPRLWLYPAGELCCSNLVGTLNEQAFLSLQLATHDPASESQKPFHIHQKCYSSLMCRQPKLHHPACKALYRTLRSHPIFQTHHPRLL